MTMSDRDRALDLLSAANTRYGDAFRRWQADPTAATQKVRDDAAGDIRNAELDLKDALRKDGEI